MPPSLYDTYSSLLRYLARLHAWFSMVTSEYAWGMLGDFVPPPPAASPPPLGAVSGTGTDPAGSAAPAAPGAAGGTSGIAGHASGAAVLLPADGRAGADAATGRRRRPHAARVAATPARASGRRRPGCHASAVTVGAHRRPVGGGPLPSWGILILQGAARSWMIFAIVWGSIVFIGENALRGHGHTQQHDQRADHHRAGGHVRAEPRRRAHAPIAET